MQETCRCGVSTALCWVAPGEQARQRWGASCCFAMLRPCCSRGCGRARHACAAVCWGPSAAAGCTNAGWALHQSLLGCYRWWHTSCAAHWASASSPDDIFMVVEVLQEHDLTEGALHSSRDSNSTTGLIQGCSLGPLRAGHGGHRLLLPNNAVGPALLHPAPARLLRSERHQRSF